ncbi:hypothetical protein CDD82_7297 [Ophiocordyceps australis]|uniref:Uncharacterized protein n=1 Tax=Ophiocordyceps australis TaxID=1399860 RepID=A0A2C5YRL7_9HYPO|nr:hypothetical protein CDD82_7297 [Ophiocordyceps australis]
MRAVAHLLDAIKLWEEYYKTTLSDAYVRVGKETTMWNVWSRDRDWNIWDILRFHWEQTGWLCYYDHNPSLTDGLEPREAGLLGLFFTDQDGLRSPILKRGQIWTFNKTLACSAQDQAGHSRQVNAITKLFESIKPWASSSWQGVIEARIYHLRFSTDPFLQALITAWHWGKYICPGTISCTNRLTQGQLWLPRNARDMLRNILNKLRLGQRVCIVHKVPMPIVDKDTWYISGVGMSPNHGQRFL